MISILFPTIRIDNEAPSDFFRRRSLNSGRLATRHGRWSSYWATHVRRWHDHIMRGNDKNNWCHHIFNFHDGTWLQETRLQQSRGNETCRTNTRNIRGKVSKRWHDGYEEALDTPLPTPILNHALNILNSYSFEESV